MNGRKIIQSSSSLLSAILLTGFLAGPVQASHDHEPNVIVPLATGIVLGSIIFRGHDHHHYYKKRHYGHYRGHYRHDYGHRKYRHYSKSHSYGGYSRRYKHDGRDVGHGGKKRHSKRKHRH